jgi:Tfp pilus assembly protein PilF/membrane protein YdbS with pleckstrin-like domain
MELNRAVKLYGEGKLAESEKIFVDLLSVASYESIANYGVGLIRLREGDLDNAQRHLLASVQIDPQNANSYFYLGELCAMRNKTDESQAYYQKCLSLDHNHLEALAKFSLSHAASRDRIEATRPGVSTNEFGFAALLAEDKSPTAKRAIELIEVIDREITPRLTAIVLRLIGLFLLGVVTGTLLSVGLETAMPAMNLVFSPTDLVIILLWAAVLAIIPVLQVRNTRIQISRGRVKITSGILSRKITNIELYRVIDIELRRSLVNRMTGDGYVVFTLPGHPNVRRLTLKGVAPYADLEKLFENLRDLILILRSGMWGKGVIY